MEAGDEIEDFNYYGGSGIVSNADPPATINTAPVTDPDGQVHAVGSVLEFYGLGVANYGTQALGVYPVTLDLLLSSGRTKYLRLPIHVVDR